MSRDFAPPPLPIEARDGQTEVPHRELEEVAHLTLHTPVKDPGAVQGMANMILALLEERAVLWEVLAGDYASDPVHAEVTWPQRVTRVLNTED